MPTPTDYLESIVAAELRLRIYRRLDATLYAPLGAANSSMAEWETFENRLNARSIVARPVEFAAVRSIAGAFEALGDEIAYAAAEADERFGRY